MSFKGNFYVVGVGGSAGGIEALRKLFSLIPPRPNAAFVVVQHLLRTHRSFLAEVLSFVTTMDVVRIEGGEHLRAHTIYVLPEIGSLRSEMAS
jgi:chemotaxis response regulator CheB